MERKVYRLVDDLSLSGTHFKEGDYVYFDSDFPVEYLVLCNEDGTPILDYTYEEEGEEIFFDWHPACEKKCPWEHKIAFIKSVNINL